MLSGSVAYHNSIITTIMRTYDYLNYLIIVNEIHARLFTLDYVVIVHYKVFQDMLYTFHTTGNININYSRTFDFLNTALTFLSYNMNLGVLLVATALITIIRNNYLNYLITVNEIHIAYTVYFN